MPLDLAADILVIGTVGLHDSLQVALQHPDPAPFFPFRADQVVGAEHRAGHDYTFDLEGRDINL